MKIDADNVHQYDLLNCGHFIIRLTGVSNRRGSRLTFAGRENCSGFNINKYIFDGMTVGEYQQIIILNFNEDDPQYSLTKHLRFDIEKGYITLQSNRE